MTSAKGKRVCLGAFAGAYGVRGETRIKAFTADPPDVARYGPVRSEDGARSFRLEIVRVVKDDVVIARSADIKSREDAQSLAGVRFYVDRAMLPEPEDADEFYMEDLVGLEARDRAGKTLGRVVAAHDFGAGPLVEIRGAGPARMIPFTKDAVPDVDVAGGFLVIAVEDPAAATEGAPPDSEAALEAMRQEDA